MNRGKKIIRNLIILTILFVIFINRSGLYLTPLAAHESSERSIHYGPSDVAHIQDYEKGKYILGKYDKWVSCNTVNRTLFFFWRFGSQPIGFENDLTKAVDYSWDGGYKYWKLYGIINDDRIQRIEVTLNNGDVLNTTEFYDDLFLLTWEDEGDASGRGYGIKIKGYDSDNQVVFEEQR